MTAATRATCLVILILMSIFLVYGNIHAPGLAYIRASMIPFWGKFVWTDVTMAFVLIATIITAFERSVIFGIVMFVLMSIFGSIAIAGWLLWRGPEFYRRLRTAAPGA